MSINGKSIENLEWDDLQSCILVLEEGPHIEYKSDYDPSKEKHKNKLTKTVCAFANRDGGYIVIGVREESSERKLYLDGFRTELTADGLHLAISQQLDELIEPRVFGIKITIIDSPEKNRHAAVIEVPQSLSAPHRVITPSVKDFYIRGDRNNGVMSYDQIRHAFVEARRIPDYAQELREHSIKNVSDGVRSAYISGECPMICAHVIPYASFDYGVRVDCRAVAHTYVDLTTEAAPMLSRRGNADGFIAASRKGNGFIQYYRDSRIEMFSRLSLLLDESGFFAVKNLKCIWSFFKITIESLQSSGITGPYFLGVGLVGVMGKAMCINEYESCEADDLFDANNVLPEMILFDPRSEELSNSLRPVFSDIFEARNMALTDDFWGKITDEQ